jgi:3-hydroxyisobutyrate dehydrogenase
MTHPSAGRTAIGVALFGLGRMGLPMAGHMLKAGVPVTGYDPDETRRQLFRELGGLAASTAGEAARDASVALVLVGNERQVAELVSGPGGLRSVMAPGSVVAVMSTVSPAFIAELAQAMAGSGISLLDAPLCRGEHGAIAGDLLTLVAGAEEDYARTRALFGTFSGDVEYLGERIGAGSVAKTVNNLILWACVAANDEGLRIGEAWGLDRGQFRKVLLNSSADNYALRHWESLGRFLWSVKDMRIALDVAHQADVSVPLAGLLSQLVRDLDGLPHAHRLNAADT